MAQITRFADTVGDGSGSTSATGDYSVVPADFLITVPSWQGIILGTLTIRVEDDAAIVPAGYGAGAALTNGIEILVHNKAGGLLYNLTGTPVQANTDWDALGTRVDDVPANGYTVTIDLTGKLLRPGDVLTVSLSDNFTGLVEQTFSVTGELDRCQSPDTFALPASIIWIFMNGAMHLWADGSVATWQS